MKKFLSSIICLCMIFSLVSVSVQAEENTAATD